MHQWDGCVNKTYTSVSFALKYLVPTIVTSIGANIIPIIGMAKNPINILPNVIAAHLFLYTTLMVSLNVKCRSR